MDGSLVQNDTRILVTDLDHTLFRPHTEQLHEEFDAAMRQWRSGHRRWVIATGRSREQLEEFYADWNVHPDYYISRARYIHAHRGEDSPAFHSWNRRMDELTRRQDDHAEEWLGVLKEWLDQQGHAARLEENFAVFESTEDAQRAADFIADHVGEEFDVLRHRWFLIVIPEGVGKGRALTYLCRNLGWDPGQIFCVGDGMNDLDMFRSHRHDRSAAVSNAEPEIKDHLRENGGHVLPWEGGEAVVQLLRGNDISPGSRTGSESSRSDS